MEMKEMKEGNRLTLSINGRIDTITAPEFEAYVSNNFENFQEVIFDFKDVEYISSAGLRVLLEAQKKMSLIDGSLLIINVSDTVMEIFEATGFTDIIEIRK